MVNGDSNPDRLASRSPPRRRRDRTTCHDMSRNPERHDFYFKWSDICACFNQNLCTALRHSLQRKCVLELDGTTVCFIESEAYAVSFVIGFGPAGLISPVSSDLSESVPMFRWLGGRSHRSACTQVHWRTKQIMLSLFPCCPNGERGLSSCEVPLFLSLSL